MTDAKTPRRISDWDSLSLPEMMIAGPGELHQQDLEVLGRQVIAHYGDIWTDLHAQAVDVEKMGLDAVATAPQKGLEAAPGLGILGLSAAGRERVAARSTRTESWYLDLHVWDWYRREWGGWHPHPVTMPSNIVLSLLSSIQRMEEVGLEAWVAARADLAKRCREGLRDLGLEPIPAAGAEANLVVAAWADDPGGIQKHLLEHEGIMISGGLSPAHGTSIRVGLMGRTATEDMVDRLLAGVQAA